MLEEFLLAHPQDAFARYGLAVECASQGDSQAAISNFETRLSRTDDARRALTTGIDVARKTGDQHASSEMEAALAQLRQS